MLDLFSYRATAEQHYSSPPDATDAERQKMKVVRGGVVVRDFLAKRSAAFVLATSICAAVTWNDALGIAAAVMAGAGFVLDRWVLRRLHQLGLRQLHVKVAYAMAVEGRERS